MPGRYLPGISPEQIEGTPDPEPLLEWEHFRDTNTTVQQITLFTLTIFTVMSFLYEIEVYRTDREFETAGNAAVFNVTISAVYCYQFNVELVMTIDGSLLNRIKPPDLPYLEMHA